MNEPRRHFLRLTALTVGMFGFGYALVPMYKTLCNLTAFNGRTADLTVVANVSEHPDESRLVTVEFMTTVNGGRLWTFSPEQSRIQVHPGKLYTVYFDAQNTQDHALVAQAVPSIAPWQAAKHLKKTECFCFRQQPFAAGEAKRMPVRFMLDPELPPEVEAVTLSYTFFDATELARRASGSPSS